jgi:hypothetical protein
MKGLVPSCVALFCALVCSTVLALPGTFHIDQV